MFRIAHILVTIAALLACPLNCWGRSTGADATQADGCACCEDHNSGDATKRTETISDSDSSEEDSTAPCDDGCECGNCLCHGAILGNNDLTLSIEFSVLLPASLDGTAVVDLMPARGAIPTVDASPPRALLAGRSLRFAIESLQV